LSPEASGDGEWETVAKVVIKEAVKSEEQVDRE
jgi:hypothetical protein